MKKRVIEYGMIFEDLMIIREIESKKGNRYFECKCKCGEKHISSLSNLATKRSKRCSKCSIKDRKNYGLSETKEYHTWEAMKQRCLNKKHPGYKDYGGRGIKICDRWLEFENFLKDMGIAKKGLSLDRINNDGNYEPSNCRWADVYEQAINQRLQKTNTTGYRGMGYREDRNKWYIKLYRNKKVAFSKNAIETKDEAIKIWNEAIKMLTSTNFKI